jgi:hypothetical protein
MTTEHDLEGLLAEIGIRLGRSTDWEVYGYCPYHEEMLGRPDGRPTTWSVARHTGNSHCFSCGGGGTLAELIIRQRGGTMWGALGLMRDYGIDPADPDDLPDTFYERSRRRRLDEYQHLPESALDRFIDVPLSALRKRCLTPSSVKEYGVRWDGERKAWITPIRLIGGALLGWQAKNKRLFRNEPDTVPKSKTLFGIDRLEPGMTAILVESPLDVCRLYAAGFEGGVSSFGVYVSDEQMRLLASVTDEVILALDNDDSGRAETRRLVTGEAKGKRRKPAVNWAQKFPGMAVYDYGRSKAKDPGEQDDDEIEQGIEGAIPALDWSTT